MNKIFDAISNLIENAPLPIAILLIVFLFLSSIALKFFSSEKDLKARIFAFTSVLILTATLVITTYIFGYTGAEDKILPELEQTQSELNEAQEELKDADKIPSDLQKENTRLRQQVKELQDTLSAKDVALKNSKPNDTSNLLNKVDIDPYTFELQECWREDGVFRCEFFALNRGNESRLSVYSNKSFIYDSNGNSVAGREASIAGVTSERPEITVISKAKPLVQLEFEIDRLHQSNIISVLKIYMRSNTFQKRTYSTLEFKNIMFEDR